MATEHPQQWAIRTRIVLGKAGGAVAVASLKTLSGDRSPWGKNELDELIVTIGRRHGVESVSAPLATHAPDEEQAPSSLSFDSLLAWWKKHGDILVLNDPWLRILEPQKVD